MHSCASFASHEGRRWVRVDGHIMALCCRGQADKALILYCQAVLLTFLKTKLFDLFNIVIFSLLLYYSYGCYYSHIIAVKPGRFVSFCHFYQLLISCTSGFFSFFFYLFFTFIILEAGERSCSTPVQFLHSSLPSTGLSPQPRPAGAVICIAHFKGDKHNTDLRILSQLISCVFFSYFLGSPVCLSVPR